MRRRPIGISLFLAVLFAPAVFALPGAVTVLQLRLLTPLSSDRAIAGTPFETIVTAPGELGDRVFFPVGTRVFGEVVRRQRVGMGFVHGRASLDLEFLDYRLPDGRSFPLEAVLSEIDNSREAITRPGHVQGILPSDNPQGLLGGIWRTPSADLFQSSFMGMSGVMGHLFSTYAMSPTGAGLLFVVRCAFFHQPEPEIRLPAGTDMEVRVTRMTEGAPEFDPPPPTLLSTELSDWLAAQPFGTEGKKGALAADVINIAFVGSREDLINAFHVAGYVGADPQTARSISRLWQAFASQSGYPDAPASRMTYEGRDADFIFQRSLNDIAKRHHIRIWREELGAQELWLGAATHDINLKVSPTGRSLTHRIDRRIDGEREKILADLSFAGCIAPPSYVERKSAVRLASDRKMSITDGRLAVATLSGCANSDQMTYAPMPDLRASPQARAVRRVMLAARQYVMQDNPYYWIYRVIRWRNANGQDANQAN